MKILLVEDDVTLAMGIEYSLKNEGFEVKHVKNVKEANLEIKELNYDIVLLDVTLPDGSGYDICREIRMKSDVPVIF